MAAPALSYSSYALLQNAIQEFGYDNLSVFYETAFADKFGGVKWRDMYSLGQGSISETYTQIKNEKGLPVMASYVAFDAEGGTIANEGFEMSAGQMPKMSLGFEYNDKSRKEEAKLLSMGAQLPLGSVFDSFLVNNTKIIGGVHSQINYTGFQIESTGGFTTTAVNNVGSFAGLAFDFGVPTANKKKAGGYGTSGAKYAWSSASANPIGDLRDMHKYAVDNLIPVGVFRMNRATFNKLRDHATTKSAINVSLYPGIAAANLTSIVVMDAQINAYLTGIGLPPIEIVDELSLVEVFDPATRTMVRKSVRGFKDNTVLLRPAGQIGTLQWSTPYLGHATVAEPAFVTEGGMMRVSQYVNPRKESTRFEATFIGIPVLDMPDYMLYLDTSEAAS